MGWHFPLNATKWVRSSTFSPKLSFQEETSGAASGLHALASTCRAGGGSPETWPLLRGFWDRLEATTDTPGYTHYVLLLGPEPSLCQGWQVLVGKVGPPSRCEAGLPSSRDPPAHAQRRAGPQGPEQRFLPCRYISSPSENIRPHLTHNAHRGW